MVKISERVSVGLVTAFIFSIALSAFGNVWEYFWGYFSVTATICLIFGIPFSIVADHLIERIQSYQYIFSVTLYLFGGIVCNVMLFIGLSSTGISSTTINTFVFGVIASLLYLHLLLFGKYFSNNH
ncbi:hypothetical protein [Alkalibacillus almallahensis]|uniref:hypothetical protein n=1 Tax=Alkalibacillus almallahensis TaxID=1379154 RepID=UPI001421AF3A|nr:hypothetical protein [Alkalibacillus almallahensis]NIK12618.1 hypothetical protein [Alkalibacillus almallahensis]